MSEDTQKERTNLGMGLNALLGEESEDYAELDKVRQTKEVSIEFLHPGKYQPRQELDNENINDLAESIRDKGVLQPILVRRDSEDPKTYEIIAGERRWRASKLAGLSEVPVIIKEFNDEEALEVALVENLQRQDLNAIEEAEGYKRLMDEFEHTQERLAKAVGKSRSHVANTLRLLNLPENVQIHLKNGELSPGHARALINNEKADILADEIIKKGLNVRQAENLVKKGPEKPKKEKIAKDPDTINLENDLSNLLGLKVTIKFKGRGGEISFKYETLEQLDDILQRLNSVPGKSLEDSHNLASDEQEYIPKEEEEEKEDWEIALAPDELPTIEIDHKEQEVDDDIDDGSWSQALNPEVPEEEEEIPEEDTDETEDVLSEILGDSLKIGEEELPKDENDDIDDSSWAVALAPDIPDDDEEEIPEILDEEDEILDESDILIEEADDDETEAEILVEEDENDDEGDELLQNLVEKDDDDEIMNLIAEESEEESSDDTLSEVELVVSDEDEEFEKE